MSCKLQSARTLMPRAWGFLTYSEKQEGSMRGVFVGALSMDYSFFQIFELF